MSDMDARAGTVVDVVFPADGRSLPRDHALALAQALGEKLSWFASEPFAGVHPVKVVQGNDAHALLSQRARLLIRVPRDRVVSLATLAGQALNVGGCELLLGTPHSRDLLAHATLYAHAVAAVNSDELAFLESVADELKALQVRAHCVCGKRRRMAFEGRELDTFSLMLHGLTAEHSLRLQQHGVGRHRLLGCGIFVPHKSAAAVGA